MFIFYFFVNDNLILAVKDDFIDYNNEFKYKPANTRILYANIGNLPWNRYTINSSIPFDIKVKDQLNKEYYYEFDNKTYNEKLNIIFKSNCEELIIATDGTKWSPWINPKTLVNKNVIKMILEYYNKIIAFVNEKLNGDELTLNENKIPIKIIHDILLQMRYNLDDTAYYMFDIELILHRDRKLQGKHVKIVAISNGDKVNIILSKIIGVVSEDNIIYNYNPIDERNNTDFSTFVPNKKMDINTETKNSSDNTFIISDDYLNSEVYTIMYNKLLDSENVEDIDISNNNFTPKKEELVERNKCNI